MGDNSNMPHPKCIRSIITRVWNKKLVERGIPHIPNRKGAMQKAWITAPYQKWPQKIPGTLPQPHRAYSGEVCAQHAHRTHTQTGVGFSNAWPKTWAKSNQKKLTIHHCPFIEIMVLFGFHGNAQREL